MRIGSVHLRLVRRHRSLTGEGFDASACYACLAALASCLQDQPWMVVSGLVQPLRDGRFERLHSDVDIAVPLACLRAAAAAALRGGFVLTTRVLRTHVNRALDVEIHLAIAPSCLRFRSRRLRLWRRTRHGGLDDRGFPPYVDVFPYVIEHGEMRILDTGDRIAIAGPLAIDVALPGGAVVPVENPCYLVAPRVPAKLPRLRAGTTLRSSWLTRH